MSPPLAHHDLKHGLSKGPVDQHLLLWPRSADWSHPSSLGEEQDVGGSQQFVGLVQILQDHLKVQA